MLIIIINLLLEQYKRTSDTMQMSFLVTYVYEKRYNQFYMATDNIEKMHLGLSIEII